MLNTTEIKSGTKQLDYIDAWRGIAILLVIINHSSHFDISKDIGIENIDSFIWFGHHGVTLFFVLSAFTIFYSITGKDFNQKSEIFAFFIRRFFRIAPLFYLGIIFYKFIYFKLFLLDRGFFENILFIHWIDPVYYNSSHIMPGGWSITTEFTFYFFVPVLFMYINNINKAVTCFLASIFVSKILIGLLHRLHPHADTWYFPNTPVAQMPVFIIGIILYFVIIKKQQYVVKNIDILLVVSIILYQGIIGFLFLPDLSYYYAIAFSLLIYMTSRQNIPVINNAVFRFIGKVSFPLYICNFIVTWIMRDAGLSYLTHNTLINWLFRILFTTVVGIAIAAPLHFFIEVPCIKFGKQLINKLKTQRQVYA